MSKRKRLSTKQAQDFLLGNASDPRGGEGAAGGAPAQKVGVGGTSTDQPSGRTFCQYDGEGECVPCQDPQAQAQPAPANSHTTLETFPHNAGSVTRNPHNGSIFEADVLGLSSTGKRPARPSTLPATIPSVALKTVEQQEAFAEAVVEHEGIKPAASAWGLKSSAVFFHASTHPEFRKILNAAQGAVFESQVYKLDELCNKLLTMEPREMNQCANAYGRVFDYRMRIVGKLLPVIYGDKPGTQVNIQNNTGIVCTEEQRAKLIDLNQKLLTASAQTKQLDQ